MHLIVSCFVIQFTHKVIMVHDIVHVCIVKLALQTPLYSIMHCCTVHVAWVLTCVRNYDCIV